MNIKKRFSHIQIIAIGFLIIIAVGTALLMLPVSSAGEPAPFIDALFTATSASCVTGLVLHDTATYWSVFGKAVIICLIQIGGLGFMTVATFFFLFMRRRVGLRDREVMSESISSSNVGSILSLTRFIVCVTAAVELLGAAALSTRFIPRFGAVKGILYSLFHSVSAFCNAGFDLMGVEGEYSSLTAFSGDPVVNITVMLLILIGGLGFLVWSDIREKGLRFRKYTLHTKLVLIMTALLTAIPAVLFFILERDFTNAGRPVGEQILCSLFDAVTPRTAGFNTVDTASLSDTSKLLTVMLMFVGGSPGSTAGGVKTVSIAVIILFVSARIRGRTYIGAFGRRIPDGAVSKAFTVAAINLCLGLLGALIISASGIRLADALLESFSAIGTVGMSTGATRELTPFARAVVILLMYTGRLGSVSFASALLEKKARPPVTAPPEDITVG